MRMNSSKIIWPLLAASFVLSSCGRAEKEAPLAEQPPQQIFELAESELERGKAEKAAGLFADVERLYPYSEWAKRALIMSAFANHQDGNYEQSRADSQRYLDFYPADQDAAYAQYLIALSFYDQIDNVSRDQGVTFSGVASPAHSNRALP